MAKKPKRKRDPANYKWCDHGHQAKNIHRLNTGGHSGAFLCSKHWRSEMAWRKQRNTALAKSNRFPIRKWKK